MSGWLLVGPRVVDGITLDVHTFLYAAMAIVIGYQTVIFAIFTKVFAITEGLLPEDPRLKTLFRYIKLETGILAGALLLASWNWFVDLRAEFLECDFVWTTRSVANVATRDSGSDFDRARTTNCVIEFLSQHTRTGTTLIFATKRHKKHKIRNA